MKIRTSTVHPKISQRTLHLNDPKQNELYKFQGNNIKTSKYNIINFFPKCLFLQFMRVANFYFLATAVVQSISIISPLAPFSAIAPLGFVLLVSLIRESLDDIKRHRNDYKTNMQKTQIYNSENKFLISDWKDIKVGDFVKVMNGETFPADLMVISTSDELGLCYVETSNLDGERNLKCKQALEQLRNEINLSNLENIKGKIIYENPNNLIHHFKGLLQLENLLHNKNNENNKNKEININKENIFYINNQQILLRGTTLKNTQWIIGIAVYTGHDSKIMKNQGNLRHKVTHIERRLNIIAVLILLLQAILCFLLAILSSGFVKSHNGYFGGIYDSPYIYYESNSSDSWSPFLNGIITYFSFFLLLNTMIPISLIVSLEVIKVVQSIMIEFDDKMKYIPYKMSCKVLNTMIHEELGKIEYIFADKTGTLTSNNMEFKRCSINLIEFSYEALFQMCSTQEKLDKYLSSYFNNEKKQIFYDFWIALTICHDVLVDVQDGVKNFQGSSPDEVSLVESALKLNFKFLQKTISNIEIGIFDEILNFDLLARLEFTSERKRMSVIVKNPKTQKIYIYTKGADSVILPKLDKRMLNNQMSKIKEHLKIFSKDGLRTLCVAMSEISEIYFAEWISKYQKLLQEKNGIKTDLEEKRIDKDITTAEDNIEKDLILLGITAVEDKLQDDVPKVIHDLHEADIKIWMLTGDKLETAENIGYLCNLITKETKVFRIKVSDNTDLRIQFEKIRDRIKRIENNKGEGYSRQNSLQANLNLNNHEEQQFFDKQSVSMKNLPPIDKNGKLYPVSPMHALESYSVNDIYNKAMPSFRQDSFKMTFSSYALVIEGDVINRIFENRMIAEQFLSVIQKCRTVICCRSTPNQKAEIVNFMKIHLKKVTLAIGDGGNDVNMIQTADIGIGIYGKEGNQAAMSSDYSFCQFKYLWRLLFVHGRWSYLRTAYYVNFFFYKNIVFTFQQIWYAIESGFSAQSFWEDGYLLMFNSIVTNFGPSCYAAFEQDLNPSDSALIEKSFPFVYKVFKRKELFSYLNFFFWFVKGLVQSLIVFYVALICSGDKPLIIDGWTSDIWSFSINSYTSTFAVIMIELIVDTYNWTGLVHFFYWICGVLLYFPIFVFIWDQFDSPVKGMAKDMFLNQSLWLTLFINMGIMGVYKYLWYAFRKIFKSDLVDLLQIDRYLEKKKNKDLKEKEISQINHSKKINKEGNLDMALEMEKLAQKSNSIESVGNNLNNLKINK